MVMPFTNLTGNTEMVYLILNIGNELSTRLFHLRDISLIAYYSAPKLNAMNQNPDTALVRLGRIEAGRKTYREIIKLNSHVPQKARFYLDCIIYPQNLIDSMLDDLPKAGLPADNS